MAKADVVELICLDFRCTACAYLEGFACEAIPSEKAVKSEFTDSSPKCSIKAFHEEMGWLTRLRRSCFELPSWRHWTYGGGWMDLLLLLNEWLITTQATVQLWKQFGKFGDADKAFILILPLAFWQFPGSSPNKKSIVSWCWVTNRPTSGWKKGIYIFSCTLHQKLAFMKITLPFKEIILPERMKQAIC